MSRREVDLGRTRGRMKVKRGMDEAGKQQGIQLRGEDYPKETVQTQREREDENTFTLE
jgi:hypothetical protein